jgi:hypothetical protein
MNEALELFELLQEKKAREAHQPSTIVAHPVEVASRITEPLSYLALQTVEEIVGSTDFDAPQGQTSWESKMEKFVRLGHTYSSVNTVTGEKCYMVDEALYKDILLAVTARKQNENLLAAATEKLEQHIDQIESSNERVLRREKDAIEQMAQRMKNSYLSI